MKSLYSIIILLIFFSCSKNKQSQSVGSEFKIDSSFVLSYITDQLNLIQNSKRFEVSKDHDPVFKLAKKKMLFYDYKSFMLPSNIKVTISLAGMPEDFVTNGTLKIVYLMTFDQDGKQIDILRVGKKEELSDTWELETCTITGDDIQRIGKYTSIEMDSLGRGIDKTVVIKDHYKIDKLGRFVKLRE